MYDTHLGASITSIIAAMPPSLHTLLGTVEIPSDDGLALAHAIEDCTAVGASDGSVINQFDTLYGGSAATLQQQYSDNGAFSCFSPSPHSSQLCSLTTELYGFITATLLTHILCIAHGLSDGIVTVYIDNREAGKRGTADDMYINIGDYLRADHDISRLLQQLITASPVTIDYVWVKSHQDELPTGEIIHGPFLRPVQLNQYVDTLASHGRNAARDCLVPKPVFSTTVFQIYSKAGVAIDDWGHYLVNVVNGRTMREYYLERRGWTSTELGTVDWEAITLMLNATPHTKRMKILQLQHGWQNTGHQKLQFLEATDETVTEEMKRDNDVYCPFNCGDHEGRLHYMQCTQDIMKKKRQQLR
jgi:hypothetical protein